MPSSYTEDHLVEQPAIQLMQHELGWDVVNCYEEWNGGVSNQGRDGKREVVLVSRLRPALQRLNPDLPVDHSSPWLRMARAIEPFFAKATKVKAVEEICRDFFLTALSLAEANREINKLPSENSKFKPKEVASMSNLMSGFQCFLGFHRLVKLAFLLKWQLVFKESAVSRMRESGDSV